MDSIFIILVNYNKWELTDECLKSIKKSSYTNYYVVVVDNASSDDSFSVLSSLYALDDRVYIIESGVNNGFADANNIGIRFAMQNKADYIMLLNNDTVIDEKMIEILHSKASDRTVTTPKMFFYSKPNIIWYAGGEIDYLSGDIKHIGLDKPDNKSYCIEKKCSFATGCCMMINKHIFEKIGLLDVNYFMYVEDVDFSIRLKDSGIDILFLPDAKLWHKVGGSSVSSKLNIYYDTRNKLFLMDKFCFSIVAKTRIRLRILLLYIRGVLKRNNELYYKKAYIDYRRGIVGKIEL